MHHLTRFLTILLLSWAIVSPTFGAIQSPATQTRPTRKILGSTVSGRVTVQGKGKAGIAVGVRVPRMGPQMGQSYKGVTDADGNYRISDIPPGNYQVVPMAPAYVVSDFAQMGGMGKSLILAEGEKVDNIDFAIKRGAVITGRVSHSDGRPVIDERIFVMNAEGDEQRGSRYVNAYFSTDDRGIYRVYGLPAGKYKVAIGSEEDAYSMRGRPSFSRVFHPDANSAAEAKAVEIDEGSEATNVDITVGRSIETFTAAGSVVDGESGRPVPNVRIGLQRVVGNNNSPYIGTSTLSNARGEFRLDNLTPGKYSVFIMPDQNNDARAEPTRFEIVSQNLTGVLVRTIKGAVITGVIVVEGTQDPAVYNKMTKLRVFTYVRPADGVDSVNLNRASAIDQTGGFRLGGLQAGFATFQLGSTDFRANPGFVISRVERDGVVQQRPGIEIKQGEQVSGVRIIVTHGNGSIRGTVKWDGESPPAGIRMMVRLTKPGENFSNLRPQEVDARGHFVMEGLPAGTYELILNAFAPGSTARMPTVRQSVTVTDGAVTDVQVAVDTKTTTPATP